jgi:hypothetical protein
MFIQILTGGIRMFPFQQTSKPRAGLRRTTGCRCARYQPRLEILEDRMLLSAYTVDRLTDTGAGSDLFGDLRYCLTQATSGQDIVLFGVRGTINLQQALPDLLGNLSLVGPGADALTVRRDRDDAYRIFSVAAGATVLVSGLTIADGLAPSDFAFGGGILNRGTLTVSYSVLSGNSASAGGGIYNFGTLTVSNSTLSHNTADLNGGGIRNQTGASLYVSYSTFSANAAENGGGGGLITLGTEVIISHSTFSGNTATSGSRGTGDGAGLYDNGFGTLTVRDSAIYGNSAGGVGGGLANNLGEIVVSNSTLSGNTASVGGGISINFNPLWISSSTVSQNSATSAGGGIDVGHSRVNAKNTLAAGNSAPAGPDFHGILTSYGHNLIGDSSGASGFDATDVLDTDPLLGPLQGNGGPTLTHALLPGSPAIDAGDNTVDSEFDQRGEGFPRIVNGIADIGAYEVQEGQGPRPVPSPRTPSVFTVDRLTDTGAGSGLSGDLRYCLTRAISGPDTVLFGIQGTINLQRPLPNLRGNLSVIGPGADVLTVRRDFGGSYRIFTVASGTTASISGLTIANGNVFSPQGGLTGSGGGILNQGTLTVSNSTLVDNRANDTGGGIDNEATLMVSNTTFSGNMAYYGGGLANFGTATVSNCTFTGNGHAFVGDSFGGGIDNEATLAVSNSTFSGNRADYGGGISNEAGTLTVSNSTFSGNIVRNDGGAIDNEQGTLTVSNSTLSGNRAANGGGIANGFDPGPINVRNTIIAGNDGNRGPDIFGNLGSQGHNLIGNPNDGSGFDPNDLLNVDPMLGPLQDNGGPTQTMALLPGSPAIDAGDNTGAPDFDQRGDGYARIVGGTIDIGAYEVQEGPASRFAISAPAKVNSNTPFDVTVSSGTVPLVGQPTPGYLWNPVTAPTNTSSRSVPSSQEVASSDRFFASFNQEEFDVMLSGAKRDRYVQRDPWALDLFGSHHLPLV